MKKKKKYYKTKEVKFIEPCQRAHYYYYYHIFFFLFNIYHLEKFLIGIFKIIEQISGLIFHSISQILRKQLEC